MTEPDRSAELEGYPDYFLQTDDYSGIHHELEAAHDNESARRAFNLIQQNMEARNSDDSQIKVRRRFLPTVAWEHHHHATVNLVQGMLVGGRKAPNDVSGGSLPDESEAESEAEMEEKSNRITDSADGIANKAKKKNPVAFLWDSIVNRPKLVSECSEWKRLQKHAEHMQTQHLRDLLQDKERSDYMYATTDDGVYLDYSRQRVNVDTMKFLFALAEKQDLAGQIEAMMRGGKINFTEKRAVLHTALRAGKDEIGTVFVDDTDVIKEVHEVLDQIKAFTEGVRSGEIVGYTGKRLRNIVSVGIGGSYLGPEFLHECLKTEPEGVNSALGYRYVVIGCFALYCMVI